MTTMARKYIKAAVSRGLCTVSWDKLITKIDPELTLYFIYVN